MTDVYNPFAPPEAAVADIVSSDGPAFQPVKILGARGRIGRMRYMAYMFGGGVIMYIAMLVLMLLLSLVVMVSMFGSGRPTGAARPDETLSMVTAIAAMVIWGIVCVLYLIFYVRATMQRCHDLDLSGWMVLLAFIPLIGMFACLYWIFAPGTKGANRYGAPPPPNSTGVKVMFWIGVGLTALMTLVMILAMVAAIAIPGLQK